MKTIITDIPDYSAFLKGERTLEIGYPWITFGSIIAIEKILKDSRGTFNILEMGSGGSTLFFEERCKTVLSLEDNLVWAKRVKEKLTKGNVELVCDKIPNLIKLIEGLANRYYDLILADSCSYAATYVNRFKMLNASVPKLKKGGWLVIDNYANMSFDYATGWDVYTFDMFHYSGRGTRLCKRL